MAEWDILDFNDVQQSQARERSCNTNGQVTGSRKLSSGVPLGDISSFMSKKFKAVTQSFSSGSLSSPTEDRWVLRGPLTDSEFKQCLDGDGRLVRERHFRLSCYRGGIESSLRPVAWKHLLNIYPEMLTGEQRMAYLRGLCTTYNELKSAWLNRLVSGFATEDFRLICSMVRKDVLRTDRSLSFYSKLPSHSDADTENANLRGLFNVLTTYALTHPNFSYCQGMSDLASPFLVVMKDEGEAYVCFCAVMRRLERNFAPDGLAMTKKFEHLRQLIQFYDPVLFDHLRACHAVDLLFCYRWLLLELKREFEFTDALCMLEVMWSSLPPEHVGDYSELRLFDVDIRAAVNSQLSAFPTLTIPGRMGRHCSHGSSDSRQSQVETLDHLRKCDSCLTIAKLTARDLLRPLTDDVCGSGTTSRSISTADGRLNWISQCESPKTSCEGTSSSSQGIKSRTSTSSGPTPCDQRCASSCCHSVTAANSSETSSGCPLDHKSGKPGELTPKSEPDDSKAGAMRTKSKPANGHPLGRVGGHVSPVSSSLMLISRSSSLTDFSTRHSATGEHPCLIVPNDSNSPFSRLSLKSLSAEMIYTGPPGTPKLSQAPFTEPLARAGKKPVDDLAVASIGSLGSVVENSKSSSALVSPRSLREEKEPPFTQSVEKVDKSLEIVNVTPNADWLLPPPQELGDGNPFCMFLCLTLLLEHSSAILKGAMDYNEIAIHFDRLVRKHDVKKMLHRARILYADYVKSEWMHS